MSESFRVGATGKVALAILLVVNLRCPRRKSLFCTYSPNKRNGQISAELYDPRIFCPYGRYSVKCEWQGRYESLTDHYERRSCCLNEYNN